MKFVVQRSSDWGFNPKRKPLPQCYLEQFDHNGSVTEQWCIDISTLEEMISLADKVGKCIIGQSYPFAEQPVQLLEIYDDYRE